MNQTRTADEFSVMPVALFDRKRLEADFAAAWMRQRRALVAARGAAAHRRCMSLDASGPSG